MKEFNSQAELYKELQRELRNVSHNANVDQLSQVKADLSTLEVRILALMRSGKSVLTTEMLDYIIEHDPAKPGSDATARVALTGSKLRGFTVKEIYIDDVMSYRLTPDSQQQLFEERADKFNQYKGKSTTHFYPWYRQNQKY